jgi:hypothetical protein
VHGFARGPAKPKGTNYEERTGDASERETSHLFVLGPRTLLTLGAEKDLVPGEVHACGYDCADADGEEREADFATVEVVDGGEYYRVGLEVDVENGVCDMVQLSELKKKLRRADLHA